MNLRRVIQLVQLTLIVFSIASVPGYAVSGDTTLEPATEPIPVQTNVTLAVISYMNHWCAAVEDRDADLSLSLFTPLISPDCSRDPSVADWHIKWALEHGITVFFATSFYQGNWKLFNSGFLHSRYINKIKFAVALDVSGGDWSSPEEMLAALQSGLAYYSRTYFSHPSYFMIDSRPALKLTYLDSALRRWGQTAVGHILDLVRSIPQQYGYNPFLIGGDAIWLPNEWLNKFDAIYDDDIGDTSYFHRVAGCQTASYQEVVGNEIATAQQLSIVAAQVGKPYVPDVMPGLDNSQLYARKLDNWCIKVTDPSVELFSRWLKADQMYADKKLRLVFINSWNEWNEAHSIEPAKEYAFSYIDAVREIFSTAPSKTWPPDIAPTRSGFYVEYQSEGSTLTDISINAAWRFLNQVLHNFTNAPVLHNPQAQNLSVSANDKLNSALSAFLKNDFDGATNLAKDAVQTMNAAYAAESQLSTTTAASRTVSTPSHSSVPNMAMVALLGTSAAIVAAVLLLKRRKGTP